MASYVGRRLLQVLPVLLIVSFLISALTMLVPGDPARNLAGTRASEAEVATIRHQLGLDQGFFERFWHWLTGAVHGDLGNSWFLNDSVAADIANKFPITLSIALGALVVGLLIGIPAGAVAGARPGSRFDRIVTFGTSAGLAIPDFFLALVLVAIFSVKLQWLPAISYVDFADSPGLWAEHLLLPWIALGVGNAATLARQLRTSLATTMEEDYIRTARAKGLRGRLIVGKHALKNASLTPLTILGLQFAYLLGGTVLIEQIFGISGMGAYLLQALGQKDIPVIQGVVVLAALVFLVVNLAIDIAYAFVNPKVRLA